MQLKETLKIKIYISLTIINYLLAIYLIKSTYLVPITLLFIGFVANQLLLVIGVKRITYGQEGLSSLKTSFIFIAKFVVLVLVIVYALHSVPESGFYCLLFYIFQLIILGLSIKRVHKKLRE